MSTLLPPATPLHPSPPPALIPRPARTFLAPLHPVAVLLAAALVLPPLPAAAAWSEAERGTGGAVASAAPAATAAGVEILRAGGNAADAAVATALALAVVHPQAGNLGGGGFAVLRMGGRVAALDFRETAPAAATRDMFLDDTGVPAGERSLVGPLAAGVPGTPVGLFELHRTFGRLPWAEVVAPAIRLARDGFPVTRRLQRDLERHAGLLRRFPETAAVWLPGGTVPQAGTMLRLPRLAAALDSYARSGPTALTTGPAAAAIEGASARHGGVLTAADLAAYEAVWRQPATFSVQGWHAITMPLPSSAGVILGQGAALVDRLAWDRHPRAGALRAHLLAEIWRRSYADRMLLGDPLSNGIQEATLLAPEWLDRRAAEISLRDATSSDQVLPWREGGGESPETTHLSVVDGDGGAVSLTTTLNGSFGCGLLVSELEILLNNEMDDFATAPGTPNLYGLVQGEANSVAPGRRMLSSMAPVVAWREGHTLVLGSPGGSRIPTAVIQVLLALVVDEDPLLTAVSRPRLHHQWQPDELLAEPDALGPETRQELERRGHRVRSVAALGEVHAVRRFPPGGVEAAADPRGPGAAAVERPAAP